MGSSTTCWYDLLKGDIYEQLLLKSSFPECGYYHCSIVDFHPMQTLIVRNIDIILLHFLNICFNFINYWRSSFSLEICYFLGEFVHLLLFLWELLSPYKRCFRKWYDLASIFSKEIQVSWTIPLSVYFYKIFRGRSNWSWG